jgi:hypothetical protein
MDETPFYFFPCDSFAMAIANGFVLLTTFLVAWLGEFLPLA